MTNPAEYGVHGNEAIVIREIVHRELEAENRAIRTRLIEPRGILD